MGQKVDGKKGGIVKNVERTKHQNVNNEERTKERR
jgi:hypothetical protein